MAVSTIIDVTRDFNADALVKLDVSGWDYIVVQLVSPTGTVTFSSTNDSGAVQGVSDGNASTAINFIATQGTNLNSGAATTTLAASGLVRFASIGSFLQLSGADLVTCTKILIQLYKIN